MKNTVLISTLLAISFIAFSFINPERKKKSASEIAWTTDFDAALLKAKKENKKLFVLFTGSDWCYWCKKLDGEVFKKESFAEYANENFIAVKLDFPRKSTQSEAAQRRNAEIAEEFEVEGFPTVYVMNASKKVLHITGYQKGGPDKYIKSLQSELDGK